MYQEVTTNIMVEHVFATVKFYEEKLRFQKTVSVPEVGENLDFAIVKKDNIAIMFQEKNNLIEEYPSLHVEKIEPTFTLFITVSNIEELYEELKDKVEIAKELHMTFYGRVEFAIFDNNKNILTFAM